MRVFFFLSSVEAGGVATVVRNLAKYYKQDNHTVEIVVTNPLKNSRQETLLKDSGVDIHSFNIKGYSSFSLFIIYIRTFLFILRNRDVDVIFCPGLAYFLIVFPLAKLCFLKSQIIFNPHTKISEFMTWQKGFKKFYFGLGQIFLSYADRVVAETQDAKTDMEQCFGLKNIRVIPNPIVTDNDLIFAHDKSDAPHKWLRDEKLTTLVACGRLVKDKNFDFMIDVCKILIVFNKNIRLIIIGDGPEKQNLTKQIKTNNLQNNIDLVGQTDTPKNYFYHARAVWMTSKLEGLPVVLCEAQGMGVACIVNSYSDAVKDIMIKNGTTYGLVMEDYNLDNNVKAISKYLSNPSENRSHYRIKANDYMVSNIANRYIEGL